MDRNNIPIDKKLSNMEVLNFYYNIFTDRVIANVIDLHHYTRIKVINPTFKKISETGQALTVEQLININKTNIVQARENVAKVEELIKAETEGKLAEHYSDAAIDIILAPFQKDEKGNLKETKK
jgi:hypothetical protein